MKKNSTWSNWILCFRETARRSAANPRNQSSKGREEKALCLDKSLYFPGKLKFSGNRIESVRELWWCLGEIRKIERKKNWIGGKIIKCPNLFFQTFKERKREILCRRGCCFRKMNALIFGVIYDNVMAWMCVGLVESWVGIWHWV